MAKRENPTRRLFDCACPKGQEHQRVLVSVEVSIPACLYRRVNKSALRRRSVRIEGAVWEKATTFCEKCGMVWGHDS
ncbi:MAG: hypothetical protein IT371_30425 [Deltaproteobacteria bacterium]|nr:hypothetical protein [Deltaproteobacteria bacterium]